MFDDLKIRNKLIVLVAGPLAIVVLLAGLGAFARLDSAGESRRVVALVGVARANSDVVDALQEESLAGTTFVAGDRAGGPETLDEVRAQTDRLLATSLESLEANRSASSTFRSTAGLAIDAADKLQYLRAAVEQGYTWDQVAESFASIQQSFLSVNEVVADAVTDPEVAGQLRTAVSLASYKAALANQGSILVGAGAQGGFAVEGSFDALRNAVDSASSRGSVFGSVADVDRKGDVRNALTSDASGQLELARNTAMAGGAGEAFTNGDTDLAAATGSVLDAVHEVETDLFDKVIGASNAKKTAAERTANLFLVGAVIAVIAAAAAAVFLGRRITRPLDHLTTAANTLANEHMPRLVESLRNPSEDQIERHLGSLQDIEVSSNDEIGQLARSFNDVQKVAGSVAAEQAQLLRKGIGEMFVNLARRNQTLLDRQIEFIDELERGEEDPDQLENLYRLDHLATRMRRNAESLLVLAGAEPPRRRGRPAPLANVVRAALAEVEDFERIELLSFDEVLVASNAAADLAHLLSELMENAANFSPPEAKVEVVGHRTKADGYLISISDQGIGMSADQMVDANESVARPPLVGLALSRSLGFIVVGRLAQRHQITVRLVPSPAGGVTAVVSLPSALLTEAPSLRSASPVESRSSNAIPAQAAPTERPAMLGHRPPTPIVSPPPIAPSTPDLPQRPAASAASFPPLEFAPQGEAPSTLAEAVPTGRAFDDALDALVAPPPSVFPAPKPAHVAERSTEGSAGTSGLPSRRLTASPAPSKASAGSSTATDEELPEALLFSDPSVSSAPPSGAETETATDSPVPSASPAVPVARTPTHLDGPPPPPPPPAPASLPTRAPRPERDAAEPPNGEGSSPFLSESAPPRLFGRAPDPSAPAAPEHPATPEAEPVVAASGESTQTSTGLTKRVPRKAGAIRNIPGSDVERGASATRRSPDEVRNLLSRYRDGQQRARVAEPVPVGPDGEMENQ